MPLRAILKKSDSRGNVPLFTNKSKKAEHKAQPSGQYIFIKSMI